MSGLCVEGVLRSSQPPPAQPTMVSVTLGGKLHSSEWVLASGSQRKNLIKKGMQWCVKYVVFTKFRSDFPAGFAIWWQSVVTRCPRQGVSCNILTHNVHSLLVQLSCAGTPNLSGTLSTGSGLYQNLQGESRNVAGAERCTSSYCLFLLWNN